MTSITKDSALLYWARKLLEKILDEAQNFFEDMPSDLSGGDVLTNVWEEICVQEQVEESIFYEAYEATISALIESIVEELDSTEVSTLCLLSDNLCFLSDNLDLLEEDNIENDDDLLQNNDMCIDVIHRHFLSRASDYENVNIERFKWGDEDEDEDEDEVNTSVQQSLDLESKNKIENNKCVDMNIFTDGMVLTGYLLEKNPKGFIEYAFMIAEELKTPLVTLRPYLRAWYNATRDILEDKGFDVTDLQRPEDVQKIMKFSTQLYYESDKI